MKYAKLVDGVLQLAPNMIVINGKAIYNPSPAVLKSQGYKEVISPSPPVQQEYEDEKYYEPHYEEHGDKIVKVWEEVEPPVPEPPVVTLEDRICSLETKQTEQESLNKDVTDALVELAEMVVTPNG